MAVKKTGLNIAFPIYNADGSPFHDLVIHKATYGSVVMSLGDKITGDVFYKDNTLSVTMGEYIEYNGVKYVLVNPPTVVREGLVADNGQLKGMTKYSFVFYHPMYVLSNFPFRDVAVTTDEETYLSQNKTFSWIGNLFDFVNKINKNLETTEWHVSLKISQYEQDGITETKDWQTANKLSDVLTFDKQFISDALKKSYETWEIPYFVIDYDGDLPSEYTRLEYVTITYLNQQVTQETSPFWLFLKNLSSVSSIGSKIYYCKVFDEDTLMLNLIPCIDDYDVVGLYDVVNNIFYGSNSNVTFSAEGSEVIGKGRKHGIVFGGVANEIYDYDGNVFVFSMGKGLGLKNNSRTPKNNKIVTRIAGYGSDRNIPYGYPQIIWTGDQDWDYTINNASGMQTITVGGRTIQAMSYPIYDGIVGGQKVRLIKHPFTRTTLMPSIYAETVNNKVNPYATDYDPTTEIKDYYDADNNYPNPMVAGSPSFEIHEFEDIYPRLTNNELVEVKPYDGDFELLSLAQYNTRIQQFKSRSANYNEKNALQDVYDNLGIVDSISNIGGSYTFKYETLREEEYDYGVWYHVKYTSGNINFEYYVYNGTQSPVIDITWDDSMNDDGEYNQSYFKLKFPVLNFDLYACAAVTQEMSINMRSGACIGCTFPIMVDWEDYKANFYDRDGNFDPVIGTGHPRNGDKYPNSSQGRITVVVQKDYETFGTLMPNIYQQPHTGDEFVILGISLPTSYITDAEEELDDAMKEYMLENNIYYYEYPLKFDEHYLATHTNILSQLQNNRAVHFQYGAEPTMSLFVKQITIKWGQSPLPQYDITLTDDVEIVLNKIGEVTDDVSRIRVQLSELQKYYSQNLIEAINSKLSRIEDDVCQGRITFQQGLDAIGSVIFHDEIRSPQFETGLYTGRGWRIDQLGNAEFESARIRSYLEVVELLVNRLQAQEGDTVFSDNDQIDRVDPVYSPVTPNQGDNPKTLEWFERPGTAGNYVYTKTNDTTVVQGKTYYTITSYILSLKEKYDGYITGQMYNNVIKGIINTLAAKQAGVSDVQDSQTVEVDGSNTYYTSWMRVVDTHNTDNTLGVNQIRVVLYGDDYRDPNTGQLVHLTPAGKNFEPCELMTIARWGCVDYSDPEDPDYEAIKASIIRRQRMFMISVTDGRVVKYTGVDSPILKNGNYGVTIGELPDFVKNYSSVRQVLNQVGEHTDWLYAQGVVVANFIKIDKQGLPEIIFVDCGEWVNGASILTPTPRNGIYLCNEWNEEKQQYETHDVWHNGERWRCLQHQPVVSGGVSTYYEPTLNSLYWRKMVSAGESAPIAYATPEKISIVCNNDGSVYQQVTQSISFGMRVGTNNATNIRVDSPSSTPTGVSWRATQANLGDLTISTSASASGMANGVTFKVTGAYGGKDYVSYVTVALIGSIQGEQGDPGSPGNPGTRGKMGRFFYYAGEFDSSDNDPTHALLVNDAQAPYFSHGVNASTGLMNCHVYNPTENGTFTMAQMWANSNQSWDNAPWEVMTNDFKYLITQAIFGQYAHFGSFIINGDWMISQHGVIYDTSGGVHTIDDNSSYSDYTYQNAYTLFDPDYPNSSKQNANNFVPNYAVDGKTGNTYQQNAYVNGSVKTKSMGVEFADLRSMADDSMFVVGVDTTVGGTNISGIWNFKTKYQTIFLPTNRYSNYGQRVILYNSTIGLGGANGTTIECGEIDNQRLTTLSYLRGVGINYNQSSPYEPIPLNYYYPVESIEFLNGVVELMCVPTDAQGQLCEWVVVNIGTNIYKMTKYDH